MGVAIVIVRAVPLGVGVKDSCFLPTKEKRKEVGMKEDMLNS